MKYILIFVGLFFVFILYIILRYLKLREKNNIISICMKNIEILLGHKSEQIVLALDHIKDEEISKKYIINNNMDIFEREDMLFNVSWDINKYVEEEKVNESTTEVIKNLINIEEEIEGLKDYYNMNCVNYNEFLTKKPWYIIFKLFKVNGKKVFKLRKLDSYEILKN